MRIAVIGAGGVGGYFGARLAASGEDVIFIVRGVHLAALRRSGLKVDSINGDFTVQSVNATDDPAQAGKCDVVILAVKAWQVGETASGIQPLIGSDTCVLPLQNGVEAADQLSAVLGPGHVLGGLCKLVSFVAEPGYIKHTGFDPMVAFNELDNRVTGRVERLRDAFSRAGVSALVPADIHAAIWNKFLFIAPFGGVGAVTRAPAGVIRSLPETRSMLEQAMIEVVRVARAAKISLPDDAIQGALASVDSLPQAATASMARDILAGLPSELDSQNGAVVRIGIRLKVATPINQYIHSSLLPQELKARRKVSFS